MNNKESLKKILLKHYELYPKMQLKDFFKLLYQNEFGGGHLIDDPKESLNRLEREVSEQANLSDIFKEGSLFNDIGNGLIRIDLNKLSSTKLSLETLNKFFVQSANSIVGEKDILKEKLFTLRELVQKKLLPFDIKETDDYISDFIKEDYPMTSHSEIYRDSYRPSYRVIRDIYRVYFSLFEAIDSFLKEDERIIISIDGMAASGKTSLARLIESIYDVNVFHMDDFFLRAEQRKPERFEEPGGNVDYERFKEEIILNIKKGEAFSYRPFNCQTMAMDEIVYLEPKKLNVIEGVYSNHPHFENPYSLKVFLAIDPHEQSKRILNRNGPIMHERFINEWIPLENRYFEAFHVKDNSHLVFGSN